MSILQSSALPREPLKLVREVQARIPTDFGDFQLVLYSNNHDQKEHLAMTCGPLTGENIPVRVHSECFTGEVMGSRRCDCGEQLQKGLKYIQDNGSGVVVFLRQEGRNIGLLNKLRAYNIQDKGYDTVEANLMVGRGADERDYEPAALILKDLGIQSVRLLTNNPEKIEALAKFGINVLQRLHMQPEYVSHHNAEYFVTKVKRMRHLINVPALDSAAQNDLAAAFAKESHSFASMIRPIALSSPVSDLSTSPSASDLDGMDSRSSPLSQASAEESEMGSSFSFSSSSNSDIVDPTVVADTLKILSSQRTTRPFVTLTFAQSLDGCIAAEKGKQLVLSGEQSMIMTHRLRAEQAGILVGVGTVLADNPRLTVRLVNGPNPQPIILDSSLRFPLSARLLENEKRPWIICSPSASQEKEEALTKAGARVFRCVVGASGRIVLENALQLLKTLGIETLMVEGGAEVIRSFLVSKLVDKLIVTIAPVIVAGQHAVENASRVLLPQLTNIRYEQLGQDMVMHATPLWVESAEIISQQEKETESNFSDLSNIALTADKQITFSQFKPAVNALAV